MNMTGGFDSSVLFLSSAFQPPEQMQSNTSPNMLTRTALSARRLIGACSSMSSLTLVKQGIDVTGVFDSGVVHGTASEKVLVVQRTCSAVSSLFFVF